MEEDIPFLESLLKEEPFPPHPIIPNQTKTPIKEPKHSFKTGYEHFNTNLVTNDVAESSTKNLVPIPHECKEEKIRREHADYINRMEMLFTINPRPYPSTYANTNVESFSSFLIPIQDSDPRQEEVDVVSVTDDVLPPSVDNDDSDEEVDAVVDLLPLPPPKPLDEEFDFEIVFGEEISVVRNTIVKFECIDARVKFDVFNDENNDLSYFMFDIFDKMFSLLSVESGDTIFDPAVTLGGELLVFGDGLWVICLLMGDLDFVSIEWACLGRVTMILGTSAQTGDLDFVSIEWACLGRVTMILGTSAQTDIDLFAFIHTLDPTKVRVVEREVDKLFDEGGSGNRTKQRGSAGSERCANVQLVSEATDTVAEDVAPLQPRRQRKRKTMVVGAVQMLLPGAVLNVDVRGEAIHRFVISFDSSHSGANVLEAEVDSLVRSSVRVLTVVTTVTSTINPALVVKEKHDKPSLCSADSSSAGEADPNTGVFLDLSGSDFLVGGICTVINPDTDLQNTYVPQDARQMFFSAEVRMCVEYNVKERRRLKYVVEKQDGVLKVREREIVDLKAHMLLKEAEAAEAIRLHAEASNFKIVEKSLRDEVNALKERNTILEKERNALDVKVTDLEASVVGKEHELTGLNAQLTSTKSQNDNLVDQVHELKLSSFGLQEKFAVYEDCMGQLEKFQDDRMKEVNDKSNELYANFIKMALHLEERFYPHLLITIFCRRWLLTHGMKLAITRCMHSLEYLSALRAAIGKAIDKGMQYGLSAGITHGVEGRALTDVTGYNPSAKVDYISTLQPLQSVNFSLLAELRSNKDTSVATLMNILRLEETLAERLGTGGTFDIVFAATVTTTTLSTTLASASTVAPISMDDYEVAGTDDQAGANGNANPFPNVDDVEFNIP
nr:hypothetical protein [Tanacetum cinerariifolium]